jgi:putative copper resistance protein D
MTLLLDIFGFLSVVLRGTVLTAQSLAIGGIVFLTLLLHPMARRLGMDGAAALRRCHRLLRWSALAFAGAELLFVLTEATVLAGTIDISLGEALGADFARFGIVAIGAGLAAAVLAGRPLAMDRFSPLPLLAVTILVAQVATSHAVAQMSGRTPLLVADFVHMAGAGAWIGGIPYLLLTLQQMRHPADQARVGRRFSMIAIGAVAILVAGGVTMALSYIGSPEALYGTAYGVMVATKVLLLLGLLFLGAMNYRLVERLRRDPGTPTLRLRRFAEVEIGVGLAVLFAAASLTSQPPAVDLTTDRATLHEMVERLTPRWPRFESPHHASLALSELDVELESSGSSNAPRPEAYVPGEGIAPPRNADDIAWSEYNHHWAGLFVLAIGLLALLERTGRANWARHWPLLFLVLAAFLFLRSDPEVWPLGTVGFLESLRDPEVVQHRIFVLLTIVFAIFEWRVRTGRLRRPGAALVFPMITAMGGTLLLTHSHALANLKDQLLIEMSHVPMALAGITAGWSRWLELRLDERGSRVSAWVWPVAFVLVGLILLNYREA